MAASRTFAFWNRVATRKWISPHSELSLQPARFAAYQKISKGIQLTSSFGFNCSDETQNTSDFLGSVWYHGASFAAAARYSRRSFRWTAARNRHARSARFGRRPAVHERLQRDAVDRGAAIRPVQ